MSYESKLRALKFITKSIPFKMRNDSGNQTTNMVSLFGFEDVYFLTKNSFCKVWCFVQLYEYLIDGIITYFINIIFKLYWTFN